MKHYGPTILRYHQLLQYTNTTIDHRNTGESSNIGVHFFAGFDLQKTFLKSQGAHCTHLRLLTL